MFQLGTTSNSIFGGLTTHFQVPGLFTCLVSLGKRILSEMGVLMTTVTAAVAAI